MPRLNTYVHVADDRGVYQQYGPDDDLPADVIKRITNPDVWEGDVPEHITDQPTPGPGQTLADAAAAAAAGQAAADDPLLKQSKDDLVALAAEWDVDDSGTKADIAGRIRAAGYTDE